MRLVEIDSTNVKDIANNWLAQGLQLVGINDGTFYFGRFEPEDQSAELGPPWQHEALEWLSNLDPAELDRMWLDSASLDDPGGAVAILNVLKSMLAESLKGVNV